MWDRIVGCTRVPDAPLRSGESRTYGYQRAVLLVSFTLVAATQMSRAANLGLAGGAGFGTFVAALYAACVFFAWRFVVRVSDIGITAAAPNRRRTFTPWSDIRGFVVVPSWGGSSKRVDIIRTDGSTVPLDALGGSNFWRHRIELYRDALEAERRLTIPS